jgi:hypothetical protein
MGTNQSYELDWNTINEFKNRINQKSFDPIMVGRIQKLLIELCNRVDCAEILINIINNTTDFKYNGIAANRLELSSTKLPYDTKEMIDIIFRFLKEILYTNNRLIGISQESVITLNQISHMTDDILYEYLIRSITIFRYPSTELGNNIYHLLFTYSYYQ